MQKNYTMYIFTLLPFPLPTPHPHTHAEKKYKLQLYLPKCGVQVLFLALLERV